MPGSGADVCTDRLSLRDRRRGMRKNNRYPGRLCCAAAGGAGCPRGLPDAPRVLSDAPRCGLSDPPKRSAPAGIFQSGGPGGAFRGGP